MTDRKLTCAACKSAITKGDIAGSDLEFGGELKATNQPEYTADADTDLVATVGTLDEYSPMVRTSGNQSIAGVKTFTNQMVISNNANNPLIIKSTAVSVTALSSVNTFAMKDKDDNTIFAFNYTTNSDGHVDVWINVRNADGTLKQVFIARGNTA